MKRKIKYLLAISALVASFTCIDAQAFDANKYVEYKRAKAAEARAKANADVEFMRANPGQARVTDVTKASELENLEPASGTKTDNNSTSNAPSDPSEAAVTDKNEKFYR